jgi:replicative DNA helicase
MEPTFAEDGTVRRLHRDQETAQYRQPPHNYEAEQALLGAILTNNRAYEKVSEFLAPEHFSDGLLGRIYAACGKLIERGQVADVLTLKPLFEADAALQEEGGFEFLVRLASSVITVINAEDYGRTIHDLHLRRQLIELGAEMVNEAHSHDLDAPALTQIEAAEQKLYDLATEGQYEGGFESFSRALVRAVEMAEAAHRKDSHVTGVASGLVDLDKWLGGLQRSDLVVLAGRPGMGKTALATNIAFNAADAFRKGGGGDDGAVVGFFSLEMSSEQLATRILSEEAQIPSDNIRRGAVRNEDFERLVIASQALARIPLFIDDTPALTVSGLRTRARRLKRQHGLGLVVVDYLQLLQATTASRYDSRVQEISEITRGLKTLAKELEVPVLALSQLSRAVEQREDKRPFLADLRESGSIEQDADVVMFIFRELYYLEKQEPVQRADEPGDKYDQRVQRWRQRCDETRNKAEVIIAKQRHGPTGMVSLYFDGRYTRFGDLETRHDPDEGG